MNGGSNATASSCPPRRRRGHGQNGFTSQPDAWATATFTAGVLDPGQTGHDAVLSRTAQGIYVATLGTPIGAAGTGLNGQLSVDFDAPAGAFARVVHTTDTVKTILFNDNANNAIDVTRLAVSAYRLVS